MSCRKFFIYTEPSVADPEHLIKYFEKTVERAGYSKAFKEILSNLGISMQDYIKQCELNKIQN